MEIEDPVLRSLMGDHNLNSLIKTPTCFKSDRGRCIDLILTNKQHSCFSSQTFETGFSDFHHLVYTILKTTSVKLPPKKIKYRCYRNFSESKFHNDLTELELTPRMTTTILSKVLSQHLINMHL